MRESVLWLAVVGGFSGGRDGVWGARGCRGTADIHIHSLRHVQGGYDVVEYGPREIGPPQVGIT